MSTPQPPGRDPDEAVPAAPTIPPPPPLGAVPLPTPPPAHIAPPPPPPALIEPPSIPRAAPPAPPWISLDRPAAPPPAPRPVPTPLIAAPDDASNDAADDLDRTVVVDRRPVAPWQLVIEGGPTLRLAGSRVVLGRRPAGAGGGAQELAIPDPSRTLSKVHARLDLADGVWTVTDLNATNGVIVIGADGSENLLDPGESAPIVERLVLGKVVMRVISDTGEQTL
ncbi:MAG: FHA domain-containing protein [Pseudolysinimonas sp.]|uniref:FHA domain-containing protein n=1 Tax=Pseudolysinimonas sp. TaxID=2680009 RepID=UPI003C768435